MRERTHRPDRPHNVVGMVMVTRRAVRHLRPNQCRSEAPTAPVAAMASRLCPVSGQVRLTAGNCQGRRSQSWLQIADSHDRRAIPPAPTVSCGGMPPRPAGTCDSAAKNSADECQAGGRVGVSRGEFARYGANIPSPSQGPKKPNKNPAKIQMTPRPQAADRRQPGARSTSGSIIAATMTIQYPSS
jgi:hypothetical protein